MEYQVKRLPDTLGCMPLQGEFSPECLGEYAKLEDAQIVQYVWPDEGYRPETHARVGWNEGGLHVLMYANEPVIQAKCTQIGGMVCVDSCLEFFFMPFPQRDRRYLNAEMNPLGTLHLGLGEERANRVKIEETLPEGFTVFTSEHKDAWWAVSYTIPMRYIEQVYGCTMESGTQMLGNFYCCDESVHPHFGTWAPVVAPKPDFHRPECFQTLVLE